MPIAEQDGELFLRWKCEVLVDGTFPVTDERRIERAAGAAAWKSAWNGPDEATRAETRARTVAAGLVDPKAAKRANGCSKLSVGAVLRELRGADEIWRLSFRLRIDDADALFRAARTILNSEPESAEAAALAVCAEGSGLAWSPWDCGVSIDEYPDDDTSLDELRSRSEHRALDRSAAKPEAGTRTRPRI